MQVSRWEPFGNLWKEMNRLQREMNRLFSSPVGSDGWPTLAGSFPALNIWQDEGTVYAEAELPGMELNDLEIFVTGGNQLTLKGERRPELPEKGVRHRQERGHGVFQRTLTLPFAVDADKVEARLEYGLLSVRLAKHESARPRKIQVRGE